MESILLLNSDAEYSKELEKLLSANLFGVIKCSDNLTALKKAKAYCPALLLVDISEKCKGKEFIKEFIKFSNTPFIVLTDVDDFTEKIISFELGCDDYVLTSVDKKELLYRIKAVIRRKNNGCSDGKILKLEGLTVDLSGYNIIIDNKKFKMPPKELELLYFLASNANVAFTREQILDRIWGFDYFGATRTVDVHVDRLRKKLSGHENDWKIETVYGIGYKFSI